MSSVTILPKAGEQVNHEFRIVGAITDGDVGKPVKFASADLTVELCADGDPIFGFINSIERGTDNGLIVVGVVTKGRVRVTASGSVAKNDLIEAAANTAAGTDIVKWGLVSTHSLATADVASLAASMFTKNWIALTSAVDGADFTIESV